MNNDMEMNATTAGNTKEDHMKFLHNRIESRSRRIDMIAEQIGNLQKANSRDALRLEELRLLKDIRDGRLTLVHTETGKPITMHVFKNV